MADEDWKISVEQTNRGTFYFDEVTRGWTDEEKEALRQGDLEAEEAAADAAFDLLVTVSDGDSDWYIRGS